MNKTMLVGMRVALMVVATLGARAAWADDDGSSACRDLPSQAALRNALKAAQAQANGGFGLEMWATLVNRDGASVPWRSRVAAAATLVPRGARIGRGYYHSGIVVLSVHADRVAETSG